MSSNQALIDALTLRQIFIERYSKGEAARLVKYLDELSARLKVEVASKYDPFRAVALSTQIAQITQVLLDEYGEDLYRGLEDFAEQEAEFARGAILAATAAEDVSPGSLNQIKAAITRKPMKLIKGKETVELTIDQAAKQFSTKKAQQVAQIVRDGALVGRTSQEVVSEITSLIDNRTKAQAASLVRTATNHIGNEARSMTYAANDDVITGEEFVATLDSHTTLTCFPAETPVVPMGKLEKLYVRRYEGEFIVITTATGKQLTGTPNHPVLTSHGWLSLKEIKPSEHVIYTVGENVRGVLVGDNVGMPSTIGELADSLVDTAISNRVRESSSAVQFHGDGMAGDEEVDIFYPKALLWGGLYAYREHFGVKVMLGLRHYAVGFFRFCFAGKLFSGWCPVAKSAKAAIISVQNVIQPPLASFSGKLSQYIGWANTAVKKIKSKLLIGLDVGVSLPPLERWHHSKVFEECRNGGSGSPVFLSDASGRNAIPVLADDVISVRREFRSTHVYNLQCHTGLYIAGGMIVKNCASKDGQIYPIGEGPIPPLHWSCRSVRTPVINPEYNLGAGIEGERASADGPVSAQTTYGGWLKRQSAEVQDEVLGVERAKLFRSGKLSIGKFTDDTGKVYTLDELKRLNDLK